MEETDLEYLNALADGELSPQDITLWRNRIAAEPALARAFDLILSTKQGVQALQLADVVGIAPNAAPASAPSKTTIPTVEGSRLGRLWDQLLDVGRFDWLPTVGLNARTLGLAIVLAFAVLTGGAWLTLQQSAKQQGVEQVAQSGAAAWHARLSQQSYDVGNPQDPSRVAAQLSVGFPVPDLQGSRLFLVDSVVVEQAAEREEFAFHYSGLSGCRLTLWVGHDVQDKTTANGVENLRRWSAGDNQFVIVATRMDRGRFLAIADFVEELTEEKAQLLDEQLLAMQTAYEQSASCA